MADSRRRSVHPIISIAAAAIIPALWALPSHAEVEYVDQGRDWGANERTSFYNIDQGARIMPLSWMKALKLPDGSAFMADSMTRYGYLENHDPVGENLPIGFTVGPWQNEDWVGMNCSACHTRQISHGGKEYRIDGGPSFIEFQAFLQDMDDATQAVVNNSAEFESFAADVLGAGAPQEEIDKLKAALDAWTDRNHTLMSIALPENEWGPVRLDAVSMIFNRVTGLDIGDEADNYVIAGNIREADAPARYPFLWNAAIQDRTQWPGFSMNGNDLFALLRNVGQVYGVFAIMHPVPQDRLFRLNRNYLTINSTIFSNMGELEDLVWKIGVPRWPWNDDIDTDLAELGREIYNRPTSEGGCSDCHGIKKNFLTGTWKTPIQDVGTDARECQILVREVDAGVMAGAKVPGLDAIEDRDQAFSVLKTAVIGSVIQHLARRAFFDSRPIGLETTASNLEADFENFMSEYKLDPEDAENLMNAYPEAELDVLEAAPVLPEGQRLSGCKMESRVMEGIWAAAPYLHNGSVPTLRALLTPAVDRPKTFRVGPAYDTENIGLAEEQTMFDFVYETTGCDDEGIASGNSNCGHEYGTRLPEAEKEALLEYLKVL